VRPVSSYFLCVFDKITVTWLPDIRKNYIQIVTNILQQVKIVYTVIGRPDAGAY